MKISVSTVVVAIGIAASPIAASAQTAPISRTIPITFTGVVANDVNSTIQIRQPDGSTVPYTGPAPNYPYKPGDTVTINFNATVPTQAAFAAGAPYANQLSADGKYRFSVSSPYYNGGTAPGGVGNASLTDVSGAINPVSNSGQPQNTRMALVYDVASDTYSIDFGAGNFAAGLFNGPGMTYDPVSGLVSANASACPGGNYGCDVLGAGGISLSGNATQVSTNNIGIWAPSLPGSNDPTSGGVRGFFNMLFTGSWNLPTYGGGGGSTDVPAPGMILLFGAGAVALLQSRRRRRARA